MAELQSWLDGHGTTFELIEGSGGIFRVVCNERTIFDRATEGRFPLYHEIQLRIFRRCLRPENLKRAAREKWERILAGNGLTWDQVFQD